MFLNDFNKLISKIKNKYIFNIFLIEKYFKKIASLITIIHMPGFKVIYYIYLTYSGAIQE
jgi:hypothetical protein